VPDDSRPPDRCGGEILTATARTRSAAGTVIDGYHRDTPQVLAQQWPVFSRGSFAQDAGVRVDPGALVFTIEEKSMGAFAKSGSRPIEGVIRVAERPRAPGLWLLDSVPDPHFMQFGYTNPNDTEGIMDLLSTGAQLVLFVTGRGSVTGSAIGPIVKVTGNSATFKKMRDDMDFDAGRLLDGSVTMAPGHRRIARPGSPRGRGRAQPSRSARPPRILHHVQTSIVTGSEGGLPCLTPRFRSMASWP